METTTVPPAPPASRAVRLFASGAASTAVRSAVRRSASRAWCWASRARSCCHTAVPPNAAAAATQAARAQRDRPRARRRRRRAYRGRGGCGDRDRCGGLGGRRPGCFLPDRGDVPHDPGLEGGGRDGGFGEAEARRRGGQLADLLGAGLAVGRVPLEPAALVLVEGVQRVRTRQGVQVGRGHAVTPRQSRRRMRPSRSRVLTVPSGSVSSSATSR